MLLMIRRLFIIGTVAVALFSMIGVKSASAEEWTLPFFKPFKHSEWNCCDDSEFKFDDDSKHEANPDNNQKIEIHQKCEHVQNCVIDLNKLNEQKASSDQDYTDKSQDEFTDKSKNDYTSKDNEYKGEYDNEHDHGDGVYRENDSGSYDEAHPYQTGYGGHNHDAFGNGLSQAELDNIHKNGLKVEITLVAQKNPKLYNDVAITATDGSNSYDGVTAEFPFGEALRVGNLDEVTYTYYYAPGVISVGESFNICAKNLDTGEKSCETGINHEEHEPEEVTIEVPV